MKLFTVTGNDVFIFANSCVRKVPRCNVQLCEAEVIDIQNGEIREEDDMKQKENSVRRRN